MSFSVVLPALGESVSEATVTRWLKSKGDNVDVGDPLVEVATDKVDTEVASEASGTIVSIAVQEGETVSVGAVLAIISKGKSPSSPNEHLGEDSPAITPSVARAELGQVSTVKAHAMKDFFSPLVRHLSEAKGINPSLLNGTGAGGRVSKSDVLAVAPQVFDASHPASTTSLRSPNVLPGQLQGVVGGPVDSSLAFPAQSTKVIEVDVTRLEIIRNQEIAGFQARTGIPLPFLAVFADAATKTLREFPMINAQIDDNRIVHSSQGNVNIAIDTQEGRYWPVVKGAEELDVEGFAVAIHDASQRTRAGTLAPEGLTGGTFTITDTSFQGLLIDTSSISPSQLAVLGLGRVTRRAVVVRSKSGEGIAIRSMVYLALSYDSGAVSGSYAAGYLSALKTRLESGAFPSSAS